MIFPFIGIRVLCWFCCLLFRRFFRILRCFVLMSHAEGLVFGGCDSSFLMSQSFILSSMAWIILSCLSIFRVFGFGSILWWCFSHAFVDGLMDVGSVIVVKFEPVVILSFSLSFSLICDSFSFLVIWGVLDISVSIMERNLIILSDSCFGSERSSLDFGLCLSLVCMGDFCFSSSSVSVFCCVGSVFFPVFLVG